MLEAHTLHTVAERRDFGKAGKNLSDLNVADMEEET